MGRCTPAALRSGTCYLVRVRIRDRVPVGGRGKGRGRGRGRGRVGVGLVGSMLPALPKKLGMMKTMSSRIA